MKHNVRDSKGRFCKKPAETVTKGYKGFHKGLICLKKKYKVGETYEEHGKSICEEGMMHFCENPLDVLNFYPAIDPYTGEPNEYAEVEAIGSTIKNGIKSATNKLRIVKKISAEELIEAYVTAMSNSSTISTDYRTHVVSEEDDSHVATTGLESRAATTGDYSNAVTVGSCSHAVVAGRWSNVVTKKGYSYATAAGSCSTATTLGDFSNATAVGGSSDVVTAGYQSIAAASGNWSKAAAVGEHSIAATLGSDSRAITTGESSIAAALGAGSKAKAALGSWIVLAEYNCMDIVCIKAVQVDGQKIKADTFYKLNNGEFVEA